MGNRNSIKKLPSDPKQLRKYIDAHWHLFTEADLECLSPVKRYGNYFKYYLEEKNDIYTRFFSHPVVLDSIQRCSDWIMKEIALLDDSGLWNTVIEYILKEYGMNNYAGPMPLFWYLPKSMSIDRLAGLGANFDLLKEGGNNQNKSYAARLLTCIPLDETDKVDKWIETFGSYSVHGDGFLLCLQMYEDWDDERYNPAIENVLKIIEVVDSIHFTQAGIGYVGMVTGENTEVLVALSKRRNIEEWGETWNWKATLGRLQAQIQLLWTDSYCLATIPGFPRYIKRNGDVVWADSEETAFFRRSAPSISRNRLLLKQFVQALGFPKVSDVPDLTWHAIGNPADKTDENLRNIFCRMLGMGSNEHSDTKIVEVEKRDMWCKECGQGSNSICVPCGCHGSICSGCAESTGWLCPCGTIIEKLVRLNHSSSLTNASVEIEV